MDGIGATEMERARQMKQDAMERFVRREDLRSARPFALHSPWPATNEQRRVVERLHSSLERGERRLVLKGATGTGKTFAMSQLIAAANRPTLVLAPNKVLAAQLWAELKGFLPENAVEYFVSYYDYYRPESYQPTADVYLQKTASVNEDIDRMRHAATAALLSRTDVVVVASVSCIYGLGVPALYEGAALPLRRGETLTSLTHLTESLQRLQYEVRESGRDVRLERGEYRLVSVAGGYDLHIHPVAAEQAVCVHLVEVQSLADKAPEVKEEGNCEGKDECVGEGEVMGCNELVESKAALMSSQLEVAHIWQKPKSRVVEGGTTAVGPGAVLGVATGAALDELVVFPASHHVLPEAERARVISDIRHELREQVEALRADGRYAEASRLSERVSADLTDFVDKGYCKGLENYSRHLAGRPAGSAPLTLLDYFPADYLLLVDESHVALPQLRAMYPADRRRKVCLVEHGFRLPSALDNRPLSVDEFWERVPAAVFVSATPGRFELESAGVSHVQLPELVLRPTGILDPVVDIRPRGAQLDELIAEARSRAARGERTLATVLTRASAEALAETLRAHGLAAAHMHSGTKPLERVRVLRQLRAGELDTLVGVNLLREGLDLPEVSLVAVFDADREGFLRSTTALVQTIGRAARHVRGTALLFADRTTSSMARAIDETDRRRAIQHAHNELHGIVPTPIVPNGEGSGLMLDLLEEAKARRKQHGRAADPSAQAGGARHVLLRSAPGLFKDAAAQAPPE